MPLLHYAKKNALFGCFPLLLLVCLLVSSNAHAAPYYGEETFTYHQPDGSSFSVKLYGDEFFAYQRTLDGYEVVLDAANGYWCYAELSVDGDAFVSTGIPVVTKAFRSNVLNKSRALATGALAENQKLPQEVVIARVRAAQVEQRVDEKGRVLKVGAMQSFSDEGPLLGPPSRTTVGDFTGLCILVDFPDEPGTITTAQVDNYCNQPTGYTDFGNACSINEYYHIQSNGKLNFCNTVVGYVRMPLPKTYYDNNVDGDWGDSTAQTLVTTALNILISNGFDFTRLSRDSSGYIYSINVFYAGTCSSGWSRGLWPHSWAIPSVLVDSTNNIRASRYQMTDMGSSLQIGTFCHENGHMTCDFPDLYSYIDNEAIVGAYSLMCNSGGTHPRNIDPYLKMKAGWADVVEVTAATNVRATAQVDRNFYYKFTNPSASNEYFLIENRNDTGYEGPYGGAGACAPGAGLVVWHIYESGTNTHSSLQMTPQSYNVPYELLIVEASPTASYTPWYSNPDPYPNSSDTFYSGYGADPLSDASTPELKFWNHTTHTGRTVNSNMVMHSYGTPGEAVAYTLGSGSLSATPGIGVTTTAINVVCNAGASPEDYIFNIFNTSGGTLTYTIVDSDGWFASTPASGSVTTSSDELSVVFSASGLASGTYNGSITVNAVGASNTPLTIPLTLTVSAATVLDVSPVVISTVLLPGGSANKKFFAIANTGGGLMAYTLSHTESWLTLGSYAGQCANETDLIYLTIDAATLPGGYYFDEIEVTSSSTVEYVQVNLTVAEQVSIVETMGLTAVALILSGFGAIRLRHKKK